MERAGYYRDLAAQCVLMATNVSPSDHKAALLDMARRWTGLRAWCVAGTLQNKLSQLSTKYSKCHELKGYGSSPSGGSHESNLCGEIEREGQRPWLDTDSAQAIGISLPPRSQGWVEMPVRQRQGFSERHRAPRRRR